MTDDTSVINTQALVYLEKKTLMKRRDSWRKRKKLNKKVKQSGGADILPLFMCCKLGYRRRKGYNISQWIRVSAGRGGINDRF